MFNPFGQRMPQISAEEAQTRMESDQPPYVLDVRQPDEYRAGHIPGSHLVPLGTLDQRLQDLPKDRDILVVCRSGARSGQATVFLNGQGFNATNLAGGMMAWQGPVEA